MKRIVTVLLTLILIFSTTVVFGATDNFRPKVKWRGMTYKTSRGYLEMDNVLNNCSIEITNNKIFGYFELSNTYVSFSAEYKSSIIHQKSSFYTYEGKAIIGSDEATISIVMNKYFITGVIEGKELPLYFLVTKTNIPQAQLSEVFQIYNQELKNKNLSLDDLVMVEISEEKEIQTIEIEKSVNRIVSPFYSVIKHTKHMVIDPISYPFVISSGSLDGTLTYYTGLFDDPEARFYFDNIYGYINANTSLDNMAIENVNEPYGHLYATPPNPGRQIQTFEINDYGKKSGPYYFVGRVSITATAPVPGTELIMPLIYLKTVKYEL